MKSQSLRSFGVAVLLLSTSTLLAADDAPPATGSASGPFSRLGGMFGRHARTPPPSSSPAPDCSQIARMPNAPVTLETCEQMMKAKQAYETAAADPTAARPGDEQMSCDQIFAEMKQQNLHAPDSTKVADASAALSEKRAMVAKQQAETTALMAEEQAKIDAAAASDRAVQLATGGLVQGRGTAAAAEAAERRAKAEGERMLKESRPADEKMLGTTAGLAGDVGQQLQSNPRLARLMQLARTRRCKGG